MTWSRSEYGCTANPSGVLYGPQGVRVNRTVLFASTSGAIRGGLKKAGRGARGKGYGLASGQMGRRG